MLLDVKVIVFVWFGLVLGWGKFDREILVYIFVKEEDNIYKFGDFIRIFLGKWK